MPVFERSEVRGSALALASAALFGASAPLSKLLLPGSSPLALASLLYLGAGLGLTAVRMISRRPGPSAEAPLRWADAPLLAGIVGFGGVLGPILLLVGLQRLTGLTSTLLLNLEAPLTIILAVGLFHEHLGRRELAAVGLILLGAGLLAYRPGTLAPDGLGIAAVVGACACWALDNNLTQRLSLRDPVASARFKSLAAGCVSLGLARVTHQAFPPLQQIGAALLVGSLGYGLSIVLATRALRLLGAARQAALFATAPYVGALLAIPLLGERPSWPEAAAAALMILGVVVLVRTRHQHPHLHEALEHDHLHTHDEHHPHGPAGPAHSHLHRHEALSHEHPHASDVHHRHPHP